MSDACYCDYEPVDMLSKATPTARKPHKCSECARSIAPGERYESSQFLFDGKFHIHKTCQRCTAVRDYVKAHVPCFCWAYTEMLEAAKDTIDNYAHQAPGLFMGYGRLRVAVDRAPLFKSVTQ